MSEYRADRGNGPRAVSVSSLGGIVPFLRAKMPVASVGLVVAGVFFISMGAAAWWAVDSQDAATDQGRSDELSGIGYVLGQTAESLIAADELSSLRRIVSETSQTYQLTRCRILLPNGKILADISARDISLDPLPATWSGSLPPQQEVLIRGGEATQLLHLRIPGRGQVGLDIAASAVPAASPFWSLQAKIGVMCIGALVSLLLLHRAMRRGLRAIVAVRQALLDCQANGVPLQALEINPQLGQEAQAWNDLIHSAQKQREELALREAGETLQERRGGGGHLQAACNALWQGLILVDEHLRAQYVNGAAAALLQSNIETLEGTNIYEVLQDEKVCDAVRAAVDEPMRRRTIEEIERDNGASTSILRFVVRPVRREDPGVAMIVVEDVTQQRLAERSRNAFIASATHELRAPLTNIRLYAEMALEDAGNSPAVQSKSLDVINQETHRLDRMVADILSVAQIEAGTLSLKKDDVRLEELFNDLQTDYALQAQEKNIELTFNLPAKLPVITADRDKIMVGLHNLVSNALKYTPNDGAVTVNVTVDNEGFHAEVADTGIGIGPDDVEKVFDKFYRAKDARLETITGSGLGLAIAREVARLHGGDITVRSELDKGSAFTLTLPLAQEAA
jgi:signal transduction histidine kinase